MSDKITVKFGTYDWTANLDTKIGEASSQQLADLQNAFAKQSPDGMTCLMSLYARHKDDVFIKRRPRQPTQRTHEYELYPVFHMSNNGAPCCLDVQPHCKNNWTEMCARNLRNGKCKDEFMRCTLGAVLYPHLYTKDKQK